MSKTIDERVVEMRFDNSQFERNVATTMSTLDKFKQKLNFRGVGKGLEEVNAAAQKVDMRGLGAGIDTVTAKFSALQVIGTTALVNITNSAVNAGKRLVSSLTVDQVTAGWSKYEQKTASVQTIMNATGKSIDEVNSYLDELMWYSDETSYGFTDMTNALATMTSSGGDIEKLIPMIEGVANATAFAGKGASEFSRVMQFAINQAYSLGYMQVQDWKSIEGATVNSKQLIETLIAAGEELKKIEKGSVTIENFRSSLKDKWLDTEVMEAGFGKFAELTKAAYKAVSSGEYETASEAIAALADQYDELSVKAFTSAQEAKSFTEAIEATKDAVSSGWMNTAELIFGNYEESKKLWTDMANSLWEIFASGSESRNEILGNAMNSKWDQLIERIEDAGISADDFQNKLKETAKEHGIAIDDLIDEYGSLAKVISAGKLSKSVIVETIKKFTGNIKTAGKAVEVTSDKLEHFQNIVTKVIRGDFGDGAERIEKLTQAGENYAAVQGIVNKIWERNGKNWSDCTVKAEDLTEIIGELSETELESLGYTEEQAKALKELAEEAEKTGTPLNELIDSLEKPSGRALLFSAIGNVLEGLSKTVQTFRSAWSEIFTSDRMSAGIYNFVEGLNNLTEKLVMSDETADKLKRTFKGLIALIDIIQSVVGGGVRFAFNILSKVLNSFGLDVLDVTASIGDMIVQFRDFLFNNELVNKGFEKLAEWLVIVVQQVKGFIDAFLELPFVKEILDKIGNSIEKLKGLDLKEIGISIVDSIKNIDLSEVGKNIVEGLQNGISEKAAAIFNKVKEIGSKIIQTIKDILGIHSPSTVMYEIGSNIVGGLVNGISAGIQFIINAIAFIGSKIVDIFKNVDYSGVADPISEAFDKIKGALSGFDWRKLLAIIPIGVVLIFVKEIYDIGKKLAGGIDSINSVISGFASIETSIAGVIKSYSSSMKADVLKKIAESIAILVGAVLLLTFVDGTKLYNAVAIIGILSGILIGLAFAMDKMGSASARIDKNGIQFGGLKSGLIALAASLVLLAMTVKIIGNLDPDKAKQGFIGLAGLITAMIAVFAAYGLLVKGKAAQNINKAGKMLLEMSVSLLILVGVTKLLSGVAWPDLGKAAVFLTGFVAFVGGLVLVTKASGKNISKVGSMLVKISVAMGLMVGVCKLVNALSPEEMKKGAAFAAAFLVFVGVLVAVTKIGGNKQIAKISGLLISMSISLMLMVGVCKLVNMLSPEEMLKGATFLAGFIAFIALLVYVTKIGGDQQIAKVAATLLAMSVAVAILAGVAVLISLLDPAALWNGVGAVVALAAVMALMIAATKGASKCIGNIVALAIAVGVMAGAVAVLSNIDVDKLSGATIALTIVMGMFALILKMAGSMSKVTLTLLVMVAAIAVLGTVLYFLSSLPVESSIGAATALSIAMLAFAAAMRIISGMQGPSGMALAAMAVMTLVIVALGGVLYLLQNVNPVQGIAIVGVLAAFIAALLVAVFAMQFLQAPSGLAMVALAVVTLVVVTLAGVLYLLQGVDPAQGIATVGVITVFLAALLVAVFAMQFLQAPSLLGLAALAIATVLVVALAGVLYLLQGVDPSQSIAIVGVILVFLVGMEAVCLAASLIGAVAAPAIAGLAILVGFIAVLGLVVIGLAELAMDVIHGLPQLGTDLSDFMTNVQTFIDGIQNIPDDISEKIGKLTTAILKLTGTEILDAIASFLSGGSSLADLGTELKTFGEGMASFTSSTSNIDAAIESMSKIKDIQSSISDVDLSGLSIIGGDLKSYSDKVSVLDMAGINTSIMAIVRLSNLSTKLTTSDFSGFSNFDVVPLARKLSAYSNAVSSVNIGAVMTSILAASRLRDFINSLNNLDAGGIGNFKSAIEQLGTISITKVVESFQGGTGRLQKAGSDLIDAAVKGMRSGQGNIVRTVRGLVEIIQNAFSSRKAVFLNSGKELITYFNRGMVTQKSSVSSTAKTMASLASNSIRLKYSDFYDAGSYLAKGFANGISASAVEAQMKASTMAKNALSAVEEVLRINSPSKETKEDGQYFGEGFVDGILEYFGKAEDAGSEMSASALDGMSNSIKGLSGNFEDMFGNASDSSDSFGTLLSKALADAKEALSDDTFDNPTISPILDLSDIKSKASELSDIFDFGSSKATEKLSGDIESKLEELQGVVDKVWRGDYGIGTERADKLAVDGYDYQTIQNLVNKTADGHKLTIEDLPSELRTNLDSISSMDDTLNSIASTVNNQLQNGQQNNKILSAIESLRNGLSEISKPSYVINGITYNDDSPIANAIESLVRAAKIERRT